MVLKSVVDNFCAQPRRLGPLCLAILVGMIVMLMIARPAAANTNPSQICSCSLHR